MISIPYLTHSRTQAIVAELCQYCVHAVYRMYLSNVKCDANSLLFAEAIISAAITPLCCHGMLKGTNTFVQLTFRAPASVIPTDNYIHSRVRTH